MEQNSKQLTLLVAGLILLAALSRVITHSLGIANGFSPVIALSLFGGAYIKDKRLAFALPLGMMLLSDAFIGFHGLMWAVYGSIALGVVIGKLTSKKVTAPKIVGGSLASSTLFFIITNFAVWAQYDMYPKTMEGLGACYVAAIPFYRTGLLGDLVWCGILFGAFALAKNFLPSTQESKVK